uniref:Uncharacterized protein n=1 Tax=Physcomitrium patens TaxID=3218 RepID=A0A2K1KJZ0_PHYPA|nr:hypothetical protein PHYPA_007774 [Physcomitrium patens]
MMLSVSPGLSRPDSVSKLGLCPRQALLCNKLITLPCDLPVSLTHYLSLSLSLCERSVAVEVVSRFCLCVCVCVCSIIVLHNILS